MFGMKKSRILSIIIACSFLGLPVQPALADEYMVLPPILDEEQTLPQDQPLPGINDLNNYGQKNNYNYQQNNDYYQNTNNNSYTTSAPSEPLRGTISTVPVGTAFQIITNENINTQRVSVGEIFTSTLNHPISVDGNIIVPAGSEVIGQVTYIQDAGRRGKNAKMEIKFTSIKPPYSSKIPITGKVLTEDNTGIIKGGTLKNQLVQNVKTEALVTAGGTLIGTGIGAIAGSAGTGAAVGAAGGGIIGLGWLLWRKGKEVKVPIGTKMVVVLEQPFDVGK